MKVILSEYGARIIDVIVDDKNWYLEFRYILKNDCFMLGYIKKEEQVGIEYFYEDKVGCRFMDILTDFGRVTDWKKFKEKITRICKSDFEFKVDIPEDAIDRQELGMPNEKEELLGVREVVGIHDKQLDEIDTEITKLRLRITELESRGPVFIPQVPMWGDPPDNRYRWGETWCATGKAGSKLTDDKK